MPRINTALHAFNRGTVSPLALARVDVERLRLSAEQQTNWMPRVLGPMMLRPGTEYIRSTKDDDACKLVPFIYSSSDTAILEFTDSYVRPLVSEAPITRSAPSTTVANVTTGGGGTWSDTTSGGGSVSWGSSVLTMYLGASGAVAKTTQTVTLGVGASGVEHALRITVTRGPVTLRVGTTSGGDDYFSATTLQDGTHSLAFTPTANFYIQFECSTMYSVVVSGLTLEGAGAMTLPSPYLEADLPYLRWEQSADVVFLACAGYQQRRIERRSTRSWSIVKYKTDDGPFNSVTDDSITITPNALTGNVTLTASKNLFKSTHVGGLIRLFHNGQVASSSLSAQDTYTSTVRISGVGVDRTVTLVISGTWVGTLTVQRSFDSEDSGFGDYATYTSNTTTTFNDGLTNSVVWYRIGFKTGDYTSGTASAGLSSPTGGGAGVARIITYNSATEVYGEILSRFYNGTATNNWKFGAWSDRNGWPTSVALHEGRLTWAGNDRFWMSVSDDYSSFDPDYEGDAGPIDRTIGKGPIARINWLTSLTRLVAGADRSVISARSSSFDEPLTPTNFNLKESVTQGTYQLPAVQVDTRAVFVQASNRRVYELMFDVQSADFKANDLTRLNDQLGIDGFIDIAVQRQPDTMVHLVRGSGSVAILLYDVQDQVEAWWEYETDGFVESVCVLPGDIEDKVYYVVRRTINGSTKRFIERWARVDQCQGGSLNRNADSHVVYSDVETTTITGLDHLEGETVVVWADGADVGTKTVSGGSITLDTAAGNVIAGLGYDATFKSAKLAYAAGGGTALNQKKKVDHLGLILAHTHYQGLRYGQDIDHLDNLPLVERGKVTEANYLWQSYDEDMLELNGTWDTDARLVLEASAPRPCTVMAAVIGMSTNG